MTSKKIPKESLKKEVKNVEERIKEKDALDLSFTVLLFLKTLFASGEVISGLFMLFLTPARMSGIIRSLTETRLKMDSNDLIAHLLTHFAENFTESAQMLAAIYLLGHGVIKLVTLVLLWRKVLWAYPLSIILFFGFIIYQVTEFFSHHSISMLLVSILDLLMIILTWMEYRKMKGIWQKQ